MVNRWSHVRRILGVRLDAMGDVLMTGPAIRALAQSDGEPEVTLLVSPAGAAAAALLDGVADTIVHEAPWMKASAAQASAQSEFALIERLKAERFDAAVIFTVYSQSPLPAALVCYLAGIPLRLAHCRENPYQLLTDWVREIEPEQRIRHEVQRQLDLVATIGGTLDDERMMVRIPLSAKTEVRRRLVRLGFDDHRRWAVIHPGATAASRRYPPELFAKACRDLVGDHFIDLLFTGSGADRPLVEEIQSQMKHRSASLAGMLSLAELAALLSMAPLLISNNTGPVHIASSVGCPVVDLYALTNPQHTPWRVPARVLNHDVECKYCYSSVCPHGHNDCLRLVRPEEIVASALSLLGIRTTLAQIGAGDVHAGSECGVP
jgi:lipopolysaccharide heptosyltransferase II